MISNENKFPLNPREKLIISSSNTLSPLNVEMLNLSQVFKKVSRKTF